MAQPARLERVINHTNQLRCAASASSMAFYRPACCSFSRQVPCHNALPAMPPPRWGSVNGQALCLPIPIVSQVRTGAPSMRRVSAQSHRPPSPSSSLQDEEEEEHSSNRITLLIGISFAMFTLPWLKTHPVGLLAPALALAIPATSQALRPVLGEGLAWIASGFKWFWVHRHDSSPVGSAAPNATSASGSTHAAYPVRTPAGTSGNYPAYGGQHSVPLAMHGQQRSGQPAPYPSQGQGFAADPVNQPPHMHQQYMQPLQAPHGNAPYSNIATRQAYHYAPSGASHMPVNITNSGRVQYAASPAVSGYGTAQLVHGSYSAWPRQDSSPQQGSQSPYPSMVHQPQQQAQQASYYSDLLTPDLDFDVLPPQQQMRVHAQPSMQGRPQQQQHDVMQGYHSMDSVSSLSSVSDLVHTWTDPGDAVVQQAYAKQLQHQQQECQQSQQQHPTSHRGGKHAVGPSSVAHAVHVEVLPPAAHQSRDAYAQTPKHTHGNRGAVWPGR